MPAPCCHFVANTACHSLQAYFEHIVGRDARNDIPIVKVASEHLRLLTEAGILGEIRDRAEFLFMHRSDKLGQAISRAIAEQNHRWGWNSPSDFPDDKLEYSAARIAQHIYDIGHPQPGRRRVLRAQRHHRRSASSTSACSASRSRSWTRSPAACGCRTADGSIPPG